MNVIGRDPPGSCVFRAQMRSGVWSVTKDHVFYGDYLSRAEAVDGACAAARTVEALGGSAQVLFGRHGRVIRHQEHLRPQSHAAFGRRRSLS